MKNKLVIGVLANVDAGKTTLSENLLYLSGKINKMGRVDNQDAYLDTEKLEKERGITIFSKQALFQVGDKVITLLDTPGHVDFSMEMERTLRLLDYAILVISGADGVQGHTKTLWRLLKEYGIPTFVFVNKMDQPTTDREHLMSTLKKALSEGCIAFDEERGPSFYEEIAMRDEQLLETYVHKGTLTEEHLKKAIQKRRIFPCFFGSALKNEGVEIFMKKLIHYTASPVYKNDFGARIYKITRDEQGNRLTHLKITGGSLRVKDSIKHHEWEEKINQIRVYSGHRYEVVAEITAGSVCAVTGLTQTVPGEGLGFELDWVTPMLEPVLSYQIILPEGLSAREMMPKLREIEEEHPELHIIWNETLQEIQAKIMGEVQIEILTHIIKTRFDIDVTFGEGHIVYKETILNTVEGVGHFEPLRHYAEVHLLLEPASGLQFDTKCSEDLLGKNWQRLVLSHLEEKVHKGVLIGAAITDIKITLVSGKAHHKHTEGGDFREATYRAVRQGLCEAESILLEPYYQFQLEVPNENVGRAMTDIDLMHGTSEVQEISEDMTVLVGDAPVSTMRYYHQDVLAYTKGFGRLFTTLKGYDKCHNALEVIERAHYDPEADLSNPVGSVFCEHGAGFYVPWHEVKAHMHLELFLIPERHQEITVKQKTASYYDAPLSLEEIEQILSQATASNSGKKKRNWRQTSNKMKRYTETASHETAYRSTKPVPSKDNYLLVDGYNIIFAWEELKDLAEENMDSAKSKLLDIMSNYQAVKRTHVIVVFDAYRVKGHMEESLDYHNIRVVYTREAQTADQYIEKFSHVHGATYNITVATSDGLQQIIVRGSGSMLLSARELKIEIDHVNATMKEHYVALRKLRKDDIGDSLTPEQQERLRKALDRDASTADDK